MHVPATSIFESQNDIVGFSKYNETLWYIKHVRSMFVCVNRAHATKIQVAGRTCRSRS